MTKALHSLFVRLLLGLACTCALIPTFGIQAAHAEPTELSDLQKRIEDSARNFDEAKAASDALKASIEETQKKIDDIQTKLPSQLVKSSQAIRSHYKMANGGNLWIDVFLQTQDFKSFLATFSYLSAVQEHNAEQMRALVEMKHELDDSQAKLITDKAAADEKTAQAQKALEDAKAAREEAQKRAEAEAARQAAEATAALIQVKQSTPSAPAPTSPAPSTVDWSQDKSQFVNHWAGRINRYLAGSPLAGKGEIFASAAWDYGVDPRWSPAISNTESSKGAACFKPYNAWGWGSKSWSNWDEAIRDHIAGLARVYGPTISPTAAKKYCPPTWQHWYSATLAQMEII